MKVIRMSLPDNENRGHSAYDFVEKRGEWMWNLFGVIFPK